MFRPLRSPPLPTRTLFAETPMAGHEFPEPADRKRVADSTVDPLAVEQPRHACDPAFRHGVVVGFDGSTSSERA
ncbi:hypothetical protein ACWCQ0_49985, partial [Streptomyces massasporeus]